MYKNLLLAAVSVVVPESDDPHRYVPAVVTAARGIARKLTQPQARSTPS